MPRIAVSRRELQRAYRNHRSVYHLYSGNGGTISQSCLLLLFYAAECGLKAVWLRRQGKEDTVGVGQVFQRFDHNINAILDDLRAHPSLRLPGHLKILTKDRLPNRIIPSRRVNEAWRYGCILMDEEHIETLLIGIIRWVGGELP